MSQRRFAITLAFAACAAGQARAADNGADDLARAIAADQAAVQTASAPAAAVSMNPKLGLILDAGLAAFSDDAHLRQGGHAVDETGFTLQGLELAASASVDPFFRFDLYFNLAHLELEEVYATTLDLPWNLQARAGAMRAAFGRANPLHLHTLRFVNPPLAVTRFFGEEGFGGLGAELSWLVPLPWFVEVRLQAFDTREAAGFHSASFGHAAGASPEDLAWVARAWTSFDLGPDFALSLGASGAFGPSPRAADFVTALYGADLFLQWRPISSAEDDYAVQLAAEAILRDAGAAGGRAHGGFVELAALLGRRCLLSIRYDDIGADTDGAGVPEYDAGWQWRGSFAAAYLPSHFSKLRLQVDAGHAQGLGAAYLAVYLQLEVSAGEHGAHVF